MVKVLSTNSYYHSKSGCQLNDYLISDPLYSMYCNSTFGMPHFPNIGKTCNINISNSRFAKTYILNGCGMQPGSGACH